MTLGSMHAAVLRQRQCLCLGIRASGCQSLQERDRPFCCKQNATGKNSCRSWQLLVDDMQI